MQKYALLSGEPGILQAYNLLFLFSQHCTQSSRKDPKYCIFLKPLSSLYTHLDGFIICIPLACKLCTHVNPSPMCFYLAK